MRDARRAGSQPSGAASEVGKIAWLLRGFPSGFHHRASNKEFDHPGSILYFAVDDIRRMHQALVARGVTFRKDPHLIARLPDRDVWMAFFDDTEGKTLALMSEPPL